MLFNIKKARNIGKLSNFALKWHNMSHVACTLAFTWYNQTEQHDPLQAASHISCQWLWSLPTDRTNKIPRCRRDMSESCSEVATSSSFLTAELLKLELPLCLVGFETCRSKMERRKVLQPDVWGKVARRQGAREQGLGVHASMLFVFWIKPGSLVQWNWSSGRYCCLAPYLVINFRWLWRHTVTWNKEPPPLKPSSIKKSCLSLSIRLRAIITFVSGT